MKTDKLDGRWSIHKEWCGYPQQRWVVRFCGSWVGQEKTKRKAKELALFACIGGSLLERLLALEDSIP